MYASVASLLVLVLLALFPFLLSRTALFVRSRPFKGLLVWDHHPPACKAAPADLLLSTSSFDKRRASWITGSSVLQIPLQSAQSELKGAKRGVTILS